MESVFLDEDELQEEKIEIRRYFNAILRRWWLVLIVTIAVAIPCVLYTFSKPPEYEAQAVVQFNSFEGNDPTLTESRETVLTSRSFAEKVVAQMGLSLDIDTDEQRWRTVHPSSAGFARPTQRHGEVAVTPHSMR